MGGTFDDTLVLDHPAWLGWLRATSEADREGWAKRAKKNNVSVGDAVAGLLIFDSMCLAALECMYGDRVASCADVVKRHLEFHDRLHFTTEVGKYAGRVLVLTLLRPSRGRHEQSNAARIIFDGFRLQ